LLPAAMATATPSKRTKCNGCHTIKTNTSISITRAGKSGGKVKYKISTGGSAWAVFVGSNKIAGKAGSGGTARVPAGKKFVVFAVTGYPYYNSKKKTAK